LEELRYLSAHEKMILLALANLLYRSTKGFVSMGELESEYRDISSKSSIQPYAHTMLWNTVQEMKAKGLLITSQSGRGFRGRSTLIGLSYQPSEVIGRLELLA